MDELEKKTAQEASDQEQSKFVPIDSSGTIYPKNDPGIKAPIN
ncbi:hypothetical protein [Clostridium beijerinckii]|jgi:hypothetical protein|nr:hypothetical protein [Clostridium beijerinckii]NRT21814.1 hypothetical protein [Clostridium beijerinckii]NRT65680.1 hypothetical protein [Clostridium beijerinckii]NRT82807.1 hypothetical protein [Clostridium beijerinckii]NRU52753.1 hypothetical protein [Clostridium beijerinckii]NRZ31370.1 hypothetical protein [Clostridium beijerinckii]